MHLCHRIDCAIRDLDQIVDERKDDSMQAVQIAKSPPVQRIVLSNISWNTYECLLADYANSSVPHFTYDRGLLEIMSPSIEHEEDNRTLATVVEIVAEERETDFRNIGSTTFKRQDLQRGFEPDKGFYIRNYERVRGRKQFDLTVTHRPIC